MFTELIHENEKGTKISIVSDHCKAKRTDNKKPIRKTIHIQKRRREIHADVFITSYNDGVRTNGTKIDRVDAIKTILVLKNLFNINDDELKDLVVE